MVLSVQNLVTTFPDGQRRVSVVSAVSFEVRAGECLALVGESGCGKSMTALSILRLVPKPGRVESGAVRLAGRELGALSVPEMRQVRGREISMIFQEPMTSLNPVVRVGQQVAEAVLLHERVSKKAALARALDLFRKVGIPDPEDRLSTYPHQLSGGLKQRVMIAMALVSEPKVLLADEPTTALDVTIQAQILELMRGLQRELGTAIVLITHDLGVVNQLADSVAVMYAGQIVERGPRRQILGRPQHPYTQGLLGALPGRSTHKGRLHEIRGTVPSPKDWPSGCRFRSRCPEAIAACAKQQPEEVVIDEVRVACLRRGPDALSGLDLSASPPAAAGVLEGGES